MHDPFIGRPIDSKALSRRDFIRYTAIAGAAITMGSGTRAAAHHHGLDDFPAPTFVQSNGIRMAYYEQGEGFPVVFSHGFPELAYSWRHQLPALAKAGFRAIAPDQRGYGETERPEAIRDYDIHHLTGDMVGLLDALDIEKAVFCGHDWGGFVVWQMALLHPERVAGVIGVNTPYFPRGPVPTVQMIRAMRGEKNYIVMFQEPGVADALLAEDVRKTFTLFMRKNGVTAEEFAKLPPDAPERNFELTEMLKRTDFPGEPLLTPDEFKYYVNTFERTGFTGGINWYRNMDYNWETTEDSPTNINVPCLYVGAEDDVVLPPSMSAGMGNFIPDLEKHVIQDCGHWTQQEKPEELNRVIIEWLSRKFSD